MGKYYELKKGPDPIRPPAFQPEKTGPRITTVQPDVRLSLVEYVKYHREVHQKKIRVEDCAI